MNVAPLVSRTFVLMVVAARLHAADSSATFSYESRDAGFADVRAADEERVAASMTRDRTRLEAVLSDQLRYAHSNGHVDSKESYLDAIMTGRSVYESYDYQTREFKVIAPGVVLMTGRVIIGLGGDKQPAPIDLNFLAVWREEGGRWRFLAWQSSRNPPPPSADSPVNAPDAPPAASERSPSPPSADPSPAPN